MPFDKNAISSIHRRCPRQKALLSTRNDGGSLAIVSEPIVIPPGQADDEQQGYASVILRKGGRTLLNLQNQDEFAISFLSWDQLTLMLDIWDSNLDRTRFSTHRGLLYASEASHAVFCRSDQEGQFMSSPHARITGLIQDLYYSPESRRPLLDYEGRLTTVHARQFELPTELRRDDA